MQVTVDTAIEYYYRLPDRLRFPSYHPHYIIADAHRDNDIQTVFFIYTEGSDFYYHAFHISTVKGTDYIDIQSPYGYGGPIATTEDQKFLSNAWHAYRSWCVAKNVLVEFIRFHPVLGNEKYYCGEYCYDRSTVLIDLDEEFLLNSYSVRVRTAIRKAMKSGLVIEWCTIQEFLQIFPQLYRETMKDLHAEEFYIFSNQYFDEIKQLPKVQLALCKLDGEPVAGAIFLVDDYEMEYHLSAANTLGKKISATNLILHEAALLGKQLGCKILHLGGGTNSKEDNSLLFFKSGFSKQRGDFHIGHYIHQPLPYENFKKNWNEQYGSVSSRILFYRF